MSATMKDNPKYAEGLSSRRKIIDVFEINIGRCILCAICVDVCNFDAIEMSYETELSTRTRDGRRMALGELLERGWRWQAQSGWVPASAKNQETEV
jgi:NADH-quinone oxidoreductase subunit I